MPPRSKVITMLPAYIRQEVDRRLFENGFRDYEGLAQWVRGDGSDQPTREMSIPPVGDWLAAPHNTPAATIATAPVRGSPRIEEYDYPISDFRFGCGRHLRRPGKSSTGSNPGAHGCCEFFEETRPQERKSPYGRHP